MLTIPFMGPLVFSLTFATLFLPYYRYLEKKLKHPVLSAFVAIILFAIVLVVPLAFIGQQFIHEAISHLDTIKSFAYSKEFAEIRHRYPELAPVTTWLTKNIQTGITWITSSLIQLIQGSITSVTKLLLTFYLLFFFLKDHRAIVQGFRKFSPLTNHETNLILHRISDTLHATFFGAFAIAMIQGTLGGLMFWWLDLPAPVLWGVIMGIMSIIPMLGTFIVWVPTAIFLALQGHVGSAILLITWGIIVIGSIDNILYPILVGNRLQLHTIPMFITLIGGLAVFGGP